MSTLLPRSNAYASFVQNVVEQYPAIRKLSSAVGKHVTLLSELSKRVTARLLLETSECEQTLVCQEDHAGSLTVRFAHNVRTVLYNNDAT